MEPVHNESAQKSGIRITTSRATVGAITQLRQVYADRRRAVDVQEPMHDGGYPKQILAESDHMAEPTGEGGEPGLLDQHWSVLIRVEVFSAALLVSLNDLSYLQPAHQFSSSPRC